ncbi:DUF4156 domain-containing protein [uncultured Aquimonas sp.]|uniref:DUF4156 domain-containing protein n=1 Tax=uncultured Aquimonas sp. TaxID=385483 RepID=UPI00086B6F71|nr:DUF4156 domain-containing protein [uncultured Aquimonas sp.]ODU44542.1 MAG: hypothetical protein ABS96_18030 [Xanthomonadaceae bacterium SCN 69-123]
MSPRIHVALAAALVALLPACTWVKIEPEAKQIRVVDASADMSRCGPMLSEISVSVRDRVGFVDRNEIKVRDELETLARNQAAGGQGDTLKPLAEPMNGEQRFGTWRCGGGTPPRAQATQRAAETRPSNFEEVEVIPLED